jgi:saccharopine dehydrogenase-like NADP-dependent oxidoreductase
MKILVFGGSGKIGKAVAWDLAKDSRITRIGLVGRSAESLERTRRELDGSRMVCHAVDVGDRRAVHDAMKGYDAGALALPDRRTSYRIVHAAIEAGLPIVDMLEEYHRTPDAYETEGLEVPGGMTLERYGEWLHEQAVTKGVPFIDGMGFAPGISNVTTGEGIRKLDRAVSAVARVGGIPEKSAAARRPLRYMITWAFDHVLREYMIRLLVRQDGKVVEVDAGTGRERFVFNRFGRNEELECAITPGMPSFITSRPDLLEFAEKTVRWPGHWDGVQTLKECGLLDLEPVSVDGKPIVPRDFLLSLIVPKLKAKDGDRDVCVMYNTVRGFKDGKPKTIEYFMWDEPRDGLSSMARVTGFPVAIAARLLADGSIRTGGILPPEDCICGALYAPFIAELEKRDIRIAEVISNDPAAP